MYCQKCGIEINENQKTCSNCGEENPNFKKKYKGKKKWTISSVIVISIALLIVSLIYSNMNAEKHKALVQKVATDQMNLYRNKLIPALMGDYRGYNIENLNYTEINPNGEAKYEIQIDCNILIGDKGFNYPIKVLFDDNYTDKPQNYIYNDDISKKIVAYEKEYLAEKEKKDRLSQTMYISAKGLYAAYKKNEVDADNKYTGTTGIITGKITGIDVGYDGNPIVSLDGDEYLSDVTCVFADKSQSKQISKLKKGQVVVIKGRIVGKNIAVIRVEDCALQ